MQTEPTPIYVRRKSCLFVECTYVRMCPCVHVREYQARQGNHKRQSGVRQRKPMNPALAAAHGRAFFSLNRRRAAERNKIKKNKERPERSNQQPNPLHVRQSARQTDTDRPPLLTTQVCIPPNRSPGMPRESRCVKNCRAFAYAQYMNSGKTATGQRDTRREAYVNRCW